MIRKVYSIYDSKAERWTFPMQVEKHGDMIRSFEDIANDQNHPVGKHPTDFTLFEIGTYDDTEGVMKMNDTKYPFGLAIEYVKNPFPLNHPYTDPTSAKAETIDADKITKSENKKWQCWE